MSRIPEVGDVVDDVFRIDEELDHGNFGAIYRVHDLLEDRTLALKVQKPGPHDEDEVRQRFEREARLIYSLEHRNVVQVLYYGQTGKGLPYMAMEFLDGTDLKQLLRSGFELERDQIHRISLETLSALSAAHNVGIVHRDLKPANIFLVDDGELGYVKVLDFGFAKALDDDEGGDLTSAGTLVGSPAYMAPELVHKTDVGAHSDLYAMGLIMAEMIDGQKIVQIENIYDTIVFQGSDDPIELPESVRESPFHGVIERAVQKDVSRRYKSADQMIADLKETVGSESSANLQRYAGASNDTSAPFVVGSADEDAETVPESRGMPSMERVDEELADESDPSGEPDPPDEPLAPPGDDRQLGASAVMQTEPWDPDESRSSHPGGTPEPDDPSDTGPPSGSQSGARNRQSSGANGPVEAEPRLSDNDRRESGGAEPVEVPSDQHRTQNPGLRQTQEQKQEEVQSEAMPGSTDSNERGLLVEVVLGLLLGVVGLVVILAIIWLTQ